MVTVPDPRFDFLVDLYKPKKISPATIDFVDDAARVGEEGHQQFTDAAMAELRTADAVVYVIDAFSTGLDAASVKAEAVNFHDELGLRDLMLVENRLSRIAKQAGSPQAPASIKAEKSVLERVHTVLEGGGRIKLDALEETERKSVAGFQLLTTKPLLVAVNVAEGDIGAADEVLAEVVSSLSEIGVKAFCLSAEIELEVSELDDDEQKLFLDDLGIGESARDKLIREAYAACNLITFFTVSEKEVHAWPLARASTALEAADSIHSDLARGFIRAEVVAYDDVKQYSGWDEAKAANKMHLVGKEHVINDGDCLYIRFKV